MGNLLEEIGLTKEELQDRVVAKLCEQVSTEICFDEDGNESRQLSALMRKVHAETREHIDATIAKLAEQHILPNVTTYIEKVTLQATNQWGEKSGKSVTFIEYLVQRAEAYLVEKVDFDGKSKDEQRGYSFHEAQTRITYLVNRHLHYSIASAMEVALREGMGQMADAISQTAKIKLGEIIEKLKVKVETK